MLVGVCLLMAGVCMSPRPGVRSHSSELCGITLRPAAAKLLNDVQKGLAMPVHCSLRKHLESAEGASATSGISDGQPWIELDESAGRTEADVVHELLHLKLKARGFPRDFVVHAPAGVDPELVRLAAGQIFSLLEHRLMFPEMRRMGFDPVRRYRKEVEAYMRGTPLPSSVVLFPELQTIGYAHVVLLIGDATLTRRVEKWYVEEGWRQQLVRGRELVSYIQNANPATAEGEKNSLLVCLEEVFDRKFQAIEWNVAPPPE